MIRAIAIFLMVCSVASADFLFTVTADSHLYTRNANEMALYDQVIDSVNAEDPAFHVALGDDVLQDTYNVPEIASLQDALDREAEAVLFWGRLTSPLYRVIGNHEGNYGWPHRSGNPVAQWSLTARLASYTLPPTDSVGPDSNYWSFEHENALFVAIDPYTYTLANPHGRPDPNTIPHTGDLDTWKLGAAQLAWLEQMLSESDAQWKILLTHQLVGGTPGSIPQAYGRGGADGRFAGEWGSHIRPLLIEHGVQLVLLGHDHVFVHQPADGMHYVHCAQPSDDNYRSGKYLKGRYTYGEWRKNSGYLTVEVGSRLRVEYVRCWLPGDDPGNQFGYAFEIDSPEPPIKVPPIADPFE